MWLSRASVSSGMSQALICPRAPLDACRLLTVDLILGMCLALKAGTYCLPFCSLLTFISPPAGGFSILMIPVPVRVTLGGDGPALFLRSGLSELWQP